MSSSPTVEQLQAEFAELYPPLPVIEKPAPAPEPAPVAPKPAPAPVAAVAPAASTDAAGAPVAAAPAAAPAPAPKPAAPKAPVGPILQTEPPFGATTVDFAARGFHLDLSIPATDVVAVAERLYAHEFSLDTMTGVDWMKLGQMEVVYDFVHFTTNLHVVVRCRVPRDNPELATISSVFQGALWHERETHDFFGIRFLGHPNLVPFLLPEDATYHPLRKDFAGASD